MDKATLYIHLMIELVWRIGLWLTYLWIETKVPYIRHIDEDELWWYKYPSVDSIIPKYLVWVLITTTPLMIFFVQFVTQKEEKLTIPSIVTAFYGLTLAYCITAVFVGFMKLTVGRPRPNFYLRCFPEGYGTDIDMCEGEYHGQMDGRKGFPSAHATFVYCCMTYMCLHINYIWKLTRSTFLKGVRITFMFSLMLIATMVGISRTMDYHQHYSDVIGGGLLGTLVAIICHHFYSHRDEILDENLRKIVKKEN